MKSENFLILYRQQWTTMFKAQKGSKDIGKINPNIASWYSPKSMVKTDTQEKNWLN